MSSAEESLRCRKLLSEGLAGRGDRNMKWGLEGRRDPGKMLFKVFKDVEMVRVGLCFQLGANTERRAGDPGGRRQKRGSSKGRTVSVQEGRGGAQRLLQFSLPGAAASGH